MNVTQPWRGERGERENNADKTAEEIRWESLKQLRMNAAAGAEFIKMPGAKKKQHSRDNAAALDLFADQGGICTHIPNTGADCKRLKQPAGDLMLVSEDRVYNVLRM